MDDILEELKLPSAFMSTALKRAWCIFSLVVNDQFDGLIRAEHRTIPQIYLERANAVGARVSPKLWKENVFDRDVAESLDKMKDMPDTLREFFDLLPAEMPQHRRAIVYMITYSRLKGRELKNEVGITLTRMSTESVKEYYRRNPAFDRAAIRCLYSTVARNNKT